MFTTENRIRPEIQKLLQLFHTTKSCLEAKIGNTRILTFLLNAIVKEIHKEPEIVYVLENTHLHLTAHGFVRIVD